MGVWGVGAGVVIIGPYLTSMVFSLHYTREATPVWLWLISFSKKRLKENMSKTDFVIFTFFTIYSYLYGFQFADIFYHGCILGFFQDNVSKRIVRIIVATKAQLHEWLLFL